MEDYEVKSGTGCHIFQNAETYEELLWAILRWWAGVKEEAKGIESITFTIDDDGIKDAMVHWNYLTPDIKENLERELLKLRQAPPVAPKFISGN
jgi:hypothetical protein